MPVTARNPLRATWGLTQEVISMPFEETNSGANALALPAVCIRLTETPRPTTAQPPSPSPLRAAMVG